MRHDVLIIGAGPSGLFAAAELARHGVTARLVEQRTEPHREARATAIQPGTLEILERVGVLAPILDASEHVQCVGMYAPDLRELSAMRHAGIDCRCQFQCSLPQHETERILEAHLQSLGGHVERGVTVTKVDGDGDDIVVELLHAGGRLETVRLGSSGILIDASGAHSVTRHAMHQPLDGSTYRGSFLAAEIAMPSPFPRGEAGLVCGPSGLLLLAPLPGGRWISFQDLEEGREQVSPDEVAERVRARLGGRDRPTDVGWISPFKMHRRIVSRLTDGRRFLIGDAAHLSSAFGGEGLNAGLHDGYDLAWKLALVLCGDARPSLLDDYAIERAMADRHILEVSDQVHLGVMGAADAARQGREVHPAAGDPIRTALFRNARAMLDVDYAGSPLVVDCESAGAAGTHESCPRPGQRYPDCTRLVGISHHVLIFSAVADAAAGEGGGSHYSRDALDSTGSRASPDPLDQRWFSLVHISRNPRVNPARAGVPEGGIVLIRPDGHIGFRACSTDAAAFAALDRHLASYLVASE